MWRLISVPLALFLGSATNPGSIPTAGELSQAVAEVNDWRALGIFAFAIMLLLGALTTFAFVQLSRAHTRATNAQEALAKALTQHAVAQAEVKNSLQSVLMVVARLEQDSSK